MRGRRLVVATMVGAVATGSATFALPARAEAPVDQGWWTATTPGGLPVGGVTPPDVPAQGLLVQGGPGATTGAGDTGATAYAALVFGVVPGATIGPLKLSTASSTVSTPQPVLEVCPLTDSAFSSAQGGPMSAAPPYDCNRNVTATESSDSTFTFAVANLASDHQLAIAVLPTSPLERVVLAAPGDGALEEAVSTSSSTTAFTQDTPPPSTPDMLPGPTPATAVTTALQPPISGSAAVSPAATPAPVAAPIVAPIRAPSSTIAPDAAPVPAVVAGTTTGTSGANPDAVIIAALLVALGGAAWLTAGRPTAKPPLTGGPDPPA